MLSMQFVGIDQELLVHSRWTRPSSSSSSRRQMEQACLSPLPPPPTSLSRRMIWWSCCLIRRCNISFQWNLSFFIALISRCDCLPSVRLFIWEPLLFLIIDVYPFPRWGIKEDCCINCYRMPSKRLIASCLLECKCIRFGFNGVCLLKCWPLTS